MCNLPFDSFSFYVMCVKLMYACILSNGQQWVAAMVAKNKFDYIEFIEKMIPCYLIYDLSKHFIVSVTSFKTSSL